MLNYALNDEKSKTFVRFYKEKNDSIVIHYADKSKMVVENTDAMKAKLNRIEEKQIEEYNDSEYADNKHIRDFTLAMFGLATLGVIAISMIGGLIALFVSGWPATLGVVKASTFLYAPTALITGSFIGKKLASLKFNLFLKYKDEINEKLKEDVIVEENTNNPVVKPKKVKNLCINDVNFMSYLQVKRMTRLIDKEEKKARLAEEKEELEYNRYKALGMEPPKKLIKTNKK